MSGGEATWLSVVEVEPGVLEPVCSGVDLHAGLPGIVLFLAYLGQISGEREYTELARAGLASLLGLLRGGEPRLASCGAFDGVGGIIYALAHLGVALEDESLFSLAEAQIERAMALLGRDTPVDVVSGAAGCVLGLLSLHAVRSSGLELEAAIKLGDFLLSQGLAGDGAGSGCDPSHGPKHDVLMGGFGHGAAGHLYALWRLHEATAEDRYLRAVQQALDLWLESRGGATRRVEHDSWCRGQRGGLGALAPVLAALRGKASGTLEPLIRAAWEDELSESDCLCHGELGNMDMLLSADAAWRRDGHNPSLLGRAQAVIARASSRGWMCGVPVETVGFMDGLAGIGYELMRCSAPERAPSVLLLHPPLVTARG